MDIWETFGREAKTQKPPEVTTFFIGAKSGWFHEKYFWGIRANPGVFYSPRTWIIVQ